MPPDPDSPLFEVRSVLAPHIFRIGQREVARRSGVKQAHISFWLTGARGMSLDGAQKIATACGYELVISLRLIEQTPSQGDISAT